MRRMYSLTQLNQIVKNAIANGLLDDVDVNAKSLSADSIIENMSGYSFSLPEDSLWTKTIAYAGAVKNGNKLTLVVSGTLTKTSASASDYPGLGNFTLPPEIATKLFPITGSFIDFRIIDMFVSLGDSATVRVWTEKNNNVLSMSGYTANLEVDKTYSYRYELTFLLGDNLASQE